MRLNGPRENCILRRMSGAKKLRLPLLILLNLSIVTLALADFGKYQDRQEARRLGEYEEVLRSLQTGQLRPDANGTVRLPAHWSRLTQDGHVYQRRNEEAGVVWLFPTAVDEIEVKMGGGEVRVDRELSGYLYCAKPLPEDEDRWLRLTRMESVFVAGKVRRAAHWWHVTSYYNLQEPA